MNNTKPTREMCLMELIEMVDVLYTCPSVTESADIKRIGDECDWPPSVIAKLEQIRAEALRSAEP